MSLNKIVFNHEIYRMMAELDTAVKPFDKPKKKTPIDALNALGLSFGAAERATVEAFKSLFAW